MSYHVCKRDIEKHSTSNGKDSIWSKTTAQQDPQCKTEITAHRWQQIKTRSLTNTHAWVQQNHKITCRETERKSDIKKMIWSFDDRSLCLCFTQLMRELFTEDGNRGAEAGEQRQCEGRSDGQTVDEVMHSITDSDHPRHSLYIRHSLPFQPATS